MVLGASQARGFFVSGPCPPPKPPPQARMGLGSWGLWPRHPRPNKQGQRSCPGRQAVPQGLGEKSHDARSHLFSLGSFQSPGGPAPALAARPQMVDRGAAALDLRRPGDLGYLVGDCRTVLPGDSSRGAVFRHRLLYRFGPVLHRQYGLSYIFLPAKIWHFAVLERCRLDRLPAGGALQPLRSYTKAQG